MEFNLYDYTFGLFFSFVNMTRYIIEFLNTKIKILNLNISMWELIGSGALVAILVAVIIKKVVPLVWHHMKWFILK